MNKINNLKRAIEYHRTLATQYPNVQTVVPRVIFLALLKVTDKAEALAQAVTNFDDLTQPTNDLMDAVAELKK